MRLLHNRIAPFIFFLIITSSNLAGQDNEGNPLPHFLFPSFKQGYIKMKDGEDIAIPLNYNMLEERLIVDLHGTYRYSKNPKLIDTVFAEHRIFVPYGELLYELLSAGPATFYLQNRCNATPKGNDTGYGSHSQSIGPTKYKRFELTQVIYQYGEVAYMDLPQNVEVTPASVYWVKKGDMMEKFNTEKQFLKLFPDYHSQLKGYIKQHKLKFKNREDIIKLGNYFNTIAK
jgi:hypothetical protein